MRNVYMIAIFLTFLLWLVTSCSTDHSPGTIISDESLAEIGIDGFSLHVMDESYFGNDRTGSFSLNVADDGRKKIVEVLGTALHEQKALFAKLAYDSSQYHPEDVLFTDALGNESNVLQLSHLNADGDLHLGQAMIQPSGKTGVSGDAVFMRITFEQGSADSISGYKLGAADQNNKAAMIWQRGVSPNLQWAFGGIADYDQNSEVNIADLAPIAVSFGVTGPFDPLSLGHVVDGDGNGEVNLADITPIVLHYNEVTTGYNIFLRRIGESSPTSHQASYATEPLVLLTHDDGLEDNGVIQFSENLMAYNGMMYDDELVSLDVTDGLISIMLGGEPALIEIVPQTNPSGGRPSVLIGGDPTEMPGMEWETAIPGDGSFVDPYRIQGSAEYNFRLLDNSAQDVSEFFTYSAVVRPAESTLFDSQVFADAKETTGEWPWMLEVADTAGLLQSIPTRMVIQFSPITPGESTGFETWFVFDPISDPTDYPLADFSILPNPAPANWPIRLDASTSKIPGSTLSDFRWDIEELSTDDILGKSEINIDNPKSVLWLSNEGDHNIRLAVSDEAIPIGGSGLAEIDRACYIIEAPFGATPPTAVATATPQQVEPGEQAVLIATDSNHPLSALGYEIVDYYWELTGQGSSGTATIDDPFSSVNSVAFSADAQGTFTFTLRVLDSIGSTSSTTTQIDVETIILLPVAAFSASPNPVVVDNQVSFDASASFHNDTSLSIVEYRWDFDGDGTDDFTSASSDASHTYTETGDNSVRLTVADNDIPEKTAQTTTVVQVDPVPNDPPVAQLVITTSPTRINREITLDASGSTDSDGTIVRYEFDVDGDNDFEYDGIASIQTHTFVSTLDLWATVRVTDSGGAIRSASAPMKVLPDPSWHIEEIDDGDTTNDVGKFAHLALVDGFPAIAYYDVTDQDLKYVRAKNSWGLGVWRTSIVVSPTPGVDDGLYPVLFQVGSSNPVIAFHDKTNGELQLAAAQDSVGLAWDAPAAIDDSSYDAGQGLAGIISDNRASLSYFDTTNDRLYFVQANNEAGTSWNTPVEVAQAAGAIGANSETSLSLNVDSMPCVTAPMDGDNSLYVATTTDGSTWDPLVTIHASAGSSAATGFLLPAAYGVYYDNAGVSLMFEMATEADGSAWNETRNVIDAPLADAGELTMLGPDQTQGLIYDSYLKYFVCVGSPTAGLVAYTTEESQGTNWSPAGVIDANPGAGAYGLSMLVTDGRPAIAWWDSANGNLMYAYYD